MSTSATVSRKRRRLPQYWARSTAGSASSAATSSRAMGNASAMGRRASLPVASRAVDGEEELLFHLRPEAAHVPDLLALEGGPQVLQVADAELALEPKQGLGTEAGDLAERDEVRGVPLAELLELRDRPALEELADLLRGTLADAVDRGQLLLREGLEDRPGRRRSPPPRSRRRGRGRRSAMPRPGP